MYGPRASQVARSLTALGELGWRTTVICLGPHRHGPHWEDTAAAEPVSGVDLIRVPSPEEWFVTRAAFRLLPALRMLPDAEWVWIGRAARAATEAAKSAEFHGLVTFAQPWSDHLAGLRVHRATGLPWVAHFSDPWIDSPYARPPAWQASIWRRMEADVIREATGVIFVTAEAADLVMNKYPDEWRRKVSVVPHGFVSGVTPTRDASRRPGRLRIVYTGRFYDPLRTPLPLLDALARLNAHEPLAGMAEVIFVGPHVEPFAREAARRGLDSIVRFRGRVSPRDAAQIAADADVLLVIDAPLPVSPFLPSKLIDYLAFRKPILGLTPLNGASASLLRRLHCPVAPPDDVDAISSALRDLVRHWRSNALETSPSFGQVAAEYDIRCTTLRLNDVLLRAFNGQSQA